MLEEAPKVIELEEKDDVSEEVKDEDENSIGEEEEIEEMEEEGENNGRMTGGGAEKRVGVVMEVTTEVEENDASVDEDVGSSVEENEHRDNEEEVDRFFSN